MGNFSRSPLEVLEWNLQRGFVGLHVEQGVPVLDRDLNLLQDLITAQVRKVIGTYIGDGIAPDADAFGIAPANPGTNEFAIGAGPAGRPGVYLVHGMEVGISGATTYGAQPPVGGQALPALTTPPVGTGTRIDTVYLDLFLEEVQEAAEPDLANPADVGMRTSVRLRTGWRVRVAEGAASAPGALAGHFHSEIARLNRRAGEAAITADMIEDRRQKRLHLATVERRVRLMEELLTLPRFSTGTTASTRPLSLANGAPGDSMQLRGHNFQLPGLQVFLGNVAVVDPAPGRDAATGLETLDVKVPDVGAYDTSYFFRVVTAGGSVTAPVGFRVNAPTPPGPVVPPPEFSTGTTASTRPVSRANAKPTETVQLRGRNFLPPRQVLLNSTSAEITASGSLPGDLQFVDIRVPSLSPGSVSVSIRTDGGTVTALQQLQIDPP